MQLFLRDLIDRFIPKSSYFCSFLQFGLIRSKSPSVESSKPSFSSYGGREITKTGVSIQPKGFFKLDSKKSIGSFNPSSMSQDSNTSSVAQTSYSFSSRSATSSFQY